MQILWVLNELDLGGIEIYTTDVLPLLKKHFSVGLFLTHGLGRLVERVKKAGIPVYHKRIKGTINRKSISTATKLLREISPQIVHTHNFKTHFSIRIASILAKVPGIIPHFHSMPGERFNSNTLKWEKILFPCSDRILFVSPASQRQYQELLHIPSHSDKAKKLIMVSNAFQLEPFYNVNKSAVEKLKKAYNITDETPVVGIVARIAPVKCLETLIEAINILRNSIPQIRCIIVGDGEENYMNSLKNIVKEKSLSTNILFTGYREDVAEHIALFTVGVLCSSHEGLPHFLIEAFAEGCPVVASDVEGIKLVMTNGKEGLLSRVNDPESVARGIEKIITNPELRKQMGQNARLKSYEYDINEHIEKLCNLYEEILSSPDRETERARKWFRIKYRLKV